MNCNYGGNAQKLCKEDCIICFNKSFASHEKAKYWSNKNELKSRNVFKNSTKKILFDCNKCNHEFLITPSDVNSCGNWCGFCENRKLCYNDNCKYCFEKSFASHEKAKYWSKDNIDVPRYIFKSSNNKYLFDCDKCHHVFSMQLNNITHRGNWCSFCSSSQLCKNDDCIYCLEKSFASHEKAKFWSNKNETTPRQMFKNSLQKCFFDCDKCKHVFSVQLGHINHENNWCSFCANRKLCNNEDCTTCYENSFASHEKAKYWSNTNTNHPREIFKSSKTNIYFDCNKCNHIFLMSLSDVNKNTWCSFCGNSKLCSNKDCKICYEKSFASHKKANYWSKENNITPRELFKNSHKKYLFDCYLCTNKYESSLDSISKGTWCSCTVNKTESKLFEWFKANNYDVKKQPKYEWCKNPKTNSHLPFDFVIESLKIIIELDGAQHFRQVSNWRSSDEQQKLDIYKMEQANKNGYTVIRLLQEDVFNNKNNWENDLINNIKLYEKTTQIYMCNNNEYDCYELNFN